MAAHCGLLSDQRGRLEPLPVFLAGASRFAELPGHDVSSEA